MAFARPLVIQRNRYNDYPLELALARNLTQAERTSLLSGATVTLTVNGTVITGTVTSAAAGTVTFNIPSTVSTLAVNVSPGYVATLRVVDSAGHTRDVAQGRWLQAGGILDTAVTVTGASSATLATGTVVTGATNIRAIVLQNDRARVTYESMSDSAAAVSLYIMSDGEWRRAFNPTFGDSASVIDYHPVADRAVVLRNDGDVGEVSFEWDAITVAITERNYAGAANYPVSSASARTIATAKMRRLVRVVRGVQGYWTGFHTDPHIGPDIHLLPVGSVGHAYNNSELWGDRQIGPGPGSAVVFASTGNKAYFPAWRTQRNWTTVEALGAWDGNYSFWPGIDDPTSGVPADPAMIAMQPAGFPAQQATGPWWIADIPASDFGGYAQLCRYMVARNPQQLGAWYFDATGTRGIMLDCYVNAWQEKDGRPTKYPLFVGAEIYTPDSTAGTIAGYTGSVAYANEPTTALRTSIASKASALTSVWPE